MSSLLQPFARSGLKECHADSVVQSTFDQPCVPISQTNVTVNGFNTGIRPSGNFESITTFPVDIDAAVINQTLWFARFTLNALFWC